MQKKPSNDNSTSFSKNCLSSLNKIQCMPPSFKLVKCFSCVFEKTNCIKKLRSKGLIRAGFIILQQSTKKLFDNPSKILTLANSFTDLRFSQVQNTPTRIENKGAYSTEVGFAPLTQQPRALISTAPSAIKMLLRKVGGDRTPNNQPLT